MDGGKGLHTAPHTSQSSGDILRRVFLVFQEGQGCLLAWHLLYREMMKEENHQQAK